MYNSGVHTSRSKSRHQPKRRSFSKAFLLLVILVVFAGGGAAYALHHKGKTAPAVRSTTTTAATTKKTATTTSTTPPTPVPNPCANNTDDQNIIVSISQRHMWACANTVSQYDTPVVTGMENLAADLTPIGTYHIYGKETDITLRGSDSTGSWDDPVSYWMPFLDNQYGAYGFHDATWRALGDFGNISPYSSNASHGCVELPLAAAKWLYGWAVVGTTVTIES